MLFYTIVGGKAEEKKKKKKHVICLEVYTRIQILDWATQTKQNPTLRSWSGMECCSFTGCVLITCKNASLAKMKCIFVMWIWCDECVFLCDCSATNRFFHVINAWLSCDIDILIFANTNQLYHVNSNAAAPSRPFYFKPESDTWRLGNTTKSMLRWFPMLNWTGSFLE